MLGGKVPWQSYAQIPKSKAANASAAKNAAPQRKHGGFDSENFRACAGGFFRWGCAASAKKSPSEIFQITQTASTCWSSEHAL
jgi:hypothetical protein